MLSTTAEYALRIMVVLAEGEVGPTTSERIATLAHVPHDYSVKVLQMLARAKLVRAQRGRGGGFRLDCDPETTTLLRIVNAIDAVTRTEKCSVAANDRDSRLTALHDHLEGVVRLVNEQLDAITLAHTVADDGASPEPATPVVTVNRSRDRASF